MRITEIVVSAKGETTVQTKGYSGSDCQAAPKFLEQSLGKIVADTKTSEFFQTTPVEQHVEM